MNETAQRAEEKVSILTKFSYSMGSAASTILNTLVNAYLVYFYTDVFGLNPVAVGTMLMASRIFDAINDPMCGVMVDRTNTKFGRFRPWYLGCAIPFGIFGFLCFTAPDLSPGWKLVFAYITYNGFGVAKTALNIPMVAMLSSLTDDPYERTVLQSWRMIGGEVTGAIAAAVTIPLAVYFGHGLEADGYTGVAAVYGIFAALAVLFMFVNIKEGAAPQPTEHKQTIKESLRALKGNMPAYLCIGAFLALNIGTSLKNSGAMYFLKYRVGNVGLMSTLMLTNYLGALSLLVAPAITRKISKSRALILVFGIQLVGCAITYMGGTSLLPVYLGNIIYGFGNGVNAGLIFSLVADTIDFGEWKSGVRAQGFISSTVCFGEKLGQSLAGFFTGVILQAGAYVANAPMQSKSAMMAIDIIYSVGPVICFGIAILCMVPYSLDKKLPGIMKDLKERRGEIAAA